jgi:hypothetical protein
MKKFVTCTGIAMLVCGLVAMALMVGCEDAQQNQDITITLSSASVSGAAAVTCVAAYTQPSTVTSNTITTLFLPLEWWVGNTEMGTIASSEGYSAVYVSKSGQTGANTINVRDQRGNSGTIGITQTAVQ